MAKVPTQTDNVSSLVASILGDTETQLLLESHGVKAHSVTWEDTARIKGSCWGPNISDMTLMVMSDEPERTVTPWNFCATGAPAQPFVVPVQKSKILMPVIRKPNFADVTVDIPIDTINVPTKTGIVSLSDYLTNIGKYTGNDNIQNLLRPDGRDATILSSSQCCVLPTKRGQKTEFAVQMFNYQSYDEDPAVLVILISKDGVSTQVLERSNQPLYYDDNGTARWFTIERLQDVRERKTGEKQEKVKSFTEMKAEEKLENVLALIQVPLKQKPRDFSRSFTTGFSFGSNTAFGSNTSTATSFCFDLAEEEECCEELGFGLFGNETVYRSINTSKQKHVKGDGMDMGVIGLGSEEGFYLGTKGLKLERDERFPIRLTFQYYRVTDENFIKESDIQDIVTQLNQSLKMAVTSGSLVLNKDSGRTTEPDLSQPKDSDNPFGKLQERDYFPTATTKSTTTAQWGSDKIAGFM